MSAAGPFEAVADIIRYGPGLYIYSRLYMCGWSVSIKVAAHSCARFDALVEPLTQGAGPSVGVRSRHTRQSGFLCG